MHDSTAKRWIAFLLAALALCVGAFLFALFSYGMMESTETASSEGSSGRMGLDVSDTSALEASPDTADSLDALVESKLESMTLEQKVAQMFIIRPESLTGEDVTLEAGQTMAEVLQGYPVSGFLLVGSNL